MKKHFYTLGVILIILGCLAGLILSSIIYILGIIGVVLVLISSQNIWIKLATVILLPIILINGTMMFFFSS